MLILYEHAITLDDEIEFMWKRKLSPVTGLFIANRYSALLYGVLALTTGFVLDSEVSGMRIALTLLCSIAIRGRFSLYFVCVI